MERLAKEKKAEECAPIFMDANTMDATTRIYRERTRAMILDRDVGCLRVVDMEVVVGMEVVMTFMMISLVVMSINVVQFL
jgi:hypothetical protein